MHQNGTFAPYIPYKTILGERESFESICAANPHRFRTRKMTIAQSTNASGKDKAWPVWAVKPDSYALMFRPWRIDRRRYRVLPVGDLRLNNDALPDYPKTDTLDGKERQNTEL